MLLRSNLLDGAGHLLPPSRSKQRQGAQLWTHAFSRSANSLLMPPSGSPRFVTGPSDDRLLNRMCWAAPGGSNPPLPRPPCWAAPAAPAHSPPCLTACVQPYCVYTDQICTSERSSVRFTPPTTTISAAPGDDSTVAACAKRGGGAACAAARTGRSSARSPWAPAGQSRSGGGARG